MWNIKWKTFFFFFLSKFLRRSLIIFIIKAFRTIVFIFIFISTTFQPIRPPVFFWSLLTKFLRWSLMIFIIKAFQTIVFIFIVISTLDISWLNFWDEAWWFLSLRLFGLLSSSLLLFRQCFGRYVLRPSSSVCRTQKPSQNFELRPLLNPHVVSKHMWWFLKESAYLLDYNDLLSRPSIKLNTVWDPIIKKARWEKKHLNMGTGKKSCIIVVILDK